MFQRQIPLILEELQGKGDFRLKLEIKTSEGVNMKKVIATTMAAFLVAQVASAVSATVDFVSICLPWCNV